MKAAASGDSSVLQAHSSASPDLRDPACYPHPVERVEVIETHISFVYLAGEYAYKVKKPLRLPFLDFSTLEARRRYCEEELRLNRRTAPELYLEVVPIAGTFASPRIGGDGAAIDYALKMKRFPQEALADRMAARGVLGAAEADALAAAVAGFHTSLEAALAQSDYGSPQEVIAPALANLDALDRMALGAQDAERLARLRRWTESESTRLREAFAARKAGGFVRECHGDLHLGNIVFFDGRPLFFDGIEFDPKLRWGDTIGEAAFLAMDLLVHRASAAAWRFLNGYLEASGDYGGVHVLRWYLVYRCLVRAKVERIRAMQNGASGGASERYLALAESLTRDFHPMLVLMHGFSGSGKTAVTQRLLEAAGAIRVRSDVERKRLHGFLPGARTGAGLYGGIYSPEASRLTYERLREIARELLAAGWPAIVDAAFLRRAQRERFAALAQELRVPFLIVSCEAPLQELRTRVERRSAAARDASEAGIAVLESQIAADDPLGEDELAHAVRVDTSACEQAQRRALDAIARRLIG